MGCAVVTAKETGRKGGSAGSRENGREGGGRALSSGRCFYDEAASRRQASSDCAQRVGERECLGWTCSERHPRSDTSG
jgi:hypothetical protein